MLEALLERVHPDVLPLPERLLDVFLPDTKENKKEGETIYFSQHSQSSCVVLLVCCYLKNYAPSLSSVFCSD